MKIKEFKSVLKELAVKIRKSKHLYKECQRGNLKWEEYYAFCRQTSDWDYRSMHIAYCMLRGRKYEQIEIKTRADKPGPNWNAVDRYIETYRDIQEVSNG